MKNRRKHPFCLNCQTPLAETDNYCPAWGQENTTFHLSVRSLFHDFIQNYFNFDSRLGRTIKPFFFQPGQLTVAYSEGKRLMYVHPVRLYLIISLLFFFLFNQWNSHQNVQIFKLDFDVPSVEDTEKGLSDSLVMANKRIEEERQAVDTMSFFGNQLTYKPIDVARWIEDKSISPEALLDSMNATRKNWIDVRLTAQILRMYRDNGKSANQQIIENIPTMLFFFLPLVALIMKGLFFRKQAYYIEHLVFTVHYHSFIFALFTLIILCEVFFDFELWYVSIGLILLYGLLAMKRVYGQGYVLTFFKLLGLLLSYVYLLSIFTLLEVIISVLTF